MIIVRYCNLECKMIYNELKERGSDAFPIEFHHVDMNHPQYVMRHHWHNEIEIIRILEGELELTLNNTELCVGTEDIVFVNSDVVHGAQPKDCVYECVVFDPSKILLNTDSGRHFATGITNHSVFIFHRIKSDKTSLFNSVNRLFDALLHDDGCFQLEVVSEIYRLFAIIISEKLYSENSEYSSFLNDRNILKLKRAISYFHTNYMNDISLKSISETVGVSPKYFCSFFKQMTNMTPFEYLNTYRIEKASRELLSTDDSIMQIAYSNGFNDLSYFIKTFKRIKGTTPKLFRQSNYK